MAPVISTLLQSSLQPSSLPTYQRAWKLFSQFLHIILTSISTTLPISPPILALFIAYMYDCHYAPSTVTTYVSALGYCHKLSGFPDPTKAFFIVQMLKGYGKLGSRLDSRLPITLPILNRILESSDEICHTPVVYFGPRAHLPFLLVYGLVSSLGQPQGRGALLFNFTSLQSWWMRIRGPFL